MLKDIRDYILKQIRFFAFIATALVLSGLALSSCVYIKSIHNQYQGIINTNTAEQSAAIAIERIKVRSANKLIKDLYVEGDYLLDLVRELEARPQEVRYVTRTETIIVGSEEPETLPELPEEYLFKTGEDLVVARFAHEADAYTFQTYDLIVTSSVVITDIVTAATSTIATSYDPDHIQHIRPDLEITKYKDKRYFKPSLGVGVTGSLSTQLNPGLGASIYFSALHPTPDIDILSLRVTGSSKAIELAIDPIGYNLGKPLPVVDDLWIYGGVGVSNVGMRFGVTIGTKL